MASRENDIFWLLIKGSRKWICVINESCYGNIFPHFLSNNPLIFLLLRIRGQDLSRKPKWSSDTNTLWSRLFSDGLSDIRCSSRSPPATLWPLLRVQRRHTFCGAFRPDYNWSRQITKTSTQCDRPRPAAPHCAASATSWESRAL